MSTPNTGLPTIPSNVLQISPDFNDAMQIIDCLIQLTPMSIAATAPPVTDSTNVGQCWVVPVGATGAWAGHDKQIALCTAAGLWKYFEPSLGWYAHIRDINTLYYFTGVNWEPAPTGSGGGLPDAVADGKLYGRKDNAWVEVPAVPAGIPEAPSDGKLYGRKDGAWVEVVGGGSGIPEAPLDGKLYGRKDGGWIEVTAPVWSPPPVVDHTGTSLAASASNNGNYTRFTNAAAKTYTFSTPTAYVAGAEYHGRNVGAGDLTLVGSGVTLNPPAGGTLVVPTGGTFTIKIISATSADVMGYTVAP